MKFKLDETLPQEIADELLARGHDADTVYGEGLSGAEDAVVVKAAGAAARILMTLDKGVASHLQYPVGEHAGVILISSGQFGAGRSHVVRADSIGELARDGTHRTSDGSRPHAHPCPVTYFLA